MLSKLNSFFQSSTPIFHLDGYLRFNMLYFNPVNITKLKAKLTSIGLTSWELKQNGLMLNFEAESVLFQGVHAHSQRGDKLFSFELDFEPVVSSKKLYVVLYEFESYLKGLDAVFFMTYDVDVESEVLENPLAYSVDYLYNKIENNRNAGI